MTDHILAEKAQSLERCVAQARRYYAGHEDVFETNYLIQDAIILNIQRACQQAISIANRIAKLCRLPLPKESADVFRILAKEGLIAPELSERLAGMVGFRNIAIHEYQELDLGVVRSIVETGLDDLLAFKSAILQADPTS